MDKEKPIEKHRLSICLHLTPQFLKLINEAVAKREGMSRNFWILEAIRKELEKV